MDLQFHPLAAIFPPLEGAELACGTRRQRLYVNGTETPYFVDTASHRAHRTYGEPHGLFGAGLGEMTSAGYRIAGCFGAGKKIAVLKHRAEQMALAA